MSIEQDLMRLEEAKTALALWLTGRGAAVPENARLDELVALLDQGGEGVV